MKTPQNKPILGGGIYSPADIGLILNVPSNRIRRYINEVWDDRFGDAIFHSRYSWGDKGRKEVNFLILVELKVVDVLQEMGIPTKRIFQARESISREMKLPYPFASSRLLANSKRIWYECKDGVVSADGTGQFNFSKTVTDYCLHIEFGSDKLAKRLWPDGPKSSVVVDPRHQFGQPIIAGTNIGAQTIYRMHESGESVETLSYLYGISGKQIGDVVRFYKRVS